MLPRASSILFSKHQKLLSINFLGRLLTVILLSFFILHKYQYSSNKRKQGAIPTFLILLDIILSVSLIVAKHCCINESISISWQFISIIFTVHTFDISYFSFLRITVTTYGSQSTFWVCFCRNLSYFSPIFQRTQCISRHFFHQLFRCLIIILHITNKCLIHTFFYIQF